MKGITIAIKSVLIIAAGAIILAGVGMVVSERYRGATDKSTSAVTDAEPDKEISPGSQTSPIVNPGFEDSIGSGWNCFSNSYKWESGPEKCQYVGYGEDVYKGGNSGFVKRGAGACGIEGFSQRTTVPTDGSTTLQFWIKVDTADSGKAGVYILDKNGNTINKAATFGGGTTLEKWKKMTIDLSDQKGKVIQIVVGSQDKSQNCDKGAHGYSVWVDEFGFK